MSPESVGHGDVIAGRYRLTDLLSDHDGARFWRAADSVLSRDVAVHVLPCEDPRARGLLDAARLASGIHDRRLLRVLDADAMGDDSYAYVVHEWGQGRSIDLMLLDGPLTPRRAAWLVKEVAECLASCHVQGIAHGRLLPENVLINESGGVKLIGCVVDASLYPGPVTWPVTGQSLQEHESDIVNLAGLLYAALTGRWPGTTGSDVPAAPVDGDTVLRPRQVRAGIPRALDRICSLVLSSAGGRQLKAHDIASLLADYVGDPAPSEPTLLGAPAERDAYAWAPLGDDELTDPAFSSADLDTAVGAPVFFDDDTAVGWSDGVGEEQPDPDSTVASGTPGLFDSSGSSGSSGSATGGDAPADPPSTARAPVDGVRPLFVDDEPRPGWAPSRGDEGSGVRSLEDSRPSSAGGSLWPLVHETGDTLGGDSSRGSGRDSGRGWMRLAIALSVLVVMVIAVLLAFNLGQRSGFDRLGGGEPADSPSTAPATTDATEAADDDNRPWQVRRAIDYDPQGSDGENPEVAGAAIDGNPGTAWRTLQYRNRPDLGGLKDGVGLVLDLGRQRPVSSVAVLLRGAPTDLEVLTAPGSGSVPASRDGFERIGQLRGAPEGRSVVEAPADTTTRYVALWFTSLPPITGSEYQARLAEVVIRR